MQEIRLLVFLMIRSCNIAVFITVYLFIPFCLFRRFSATWWQHVVLIMVMN